MTGLSQRLMIKAIELLLHTRSQTASGVDPSLCMWVARDGRGQPLVVRRVPIDGSGSPGEREMVRGHMQQINATHTLRVSTGAFAKGNDIIDALQIVVRDQQGQARAWGVQVDGLHVFEVAYAGFTLDSLQNIGFGSGTPAGVPEA